MEEYERCKYTDDLFGDLNHVKKQCRNKIMAAIHETAEDLYEAGLMDKKTMREFDENCLTSIRKIPLDEISNTREHKNE